MICGNWRDIPIVDMEQSWERNQTPGKSATACWPNLANEKRKRRRHTGAILPKESCWGGGRSWLGGVDRLANGLWSNRSGDAGLKSQLMSGFWAAEHL